MAKTPSSPAVTIAALTSQTAIIDAAVAAGVRRFIPAEFGCDTAPANAAEVVPPLAMKKDVVVYLQSKEADGLSWTSICCGMWLDWVRLDPQLYTLGRTGTNPLKIVHRE
jgi:hypothetical protein